MSNKNHKISDKATAAGKKKQQDDSIIENTTYVERRRGSLFVAVALIVLVAVLWHFFKPATMVSPILTSGMWGLLVFTISVFCIGFLFVLLLGGIGFILVAIFSFFWLLLATFLFPIFFPLLLPLAIVMLFVMLCRRRRAKHQK